MPRIHSPTYSSCLWLTIPVLGLGLVAARRSEALVVSPQLGATARYENFASPATTAEHGSGWIGLLDPQIDLLHADARSNLHAVLRKRFDFRPDNQSPVPGAGLAHALLSRALTRTASVAVEARLDHVSDPFAADFTVVSPAHARYTRFGSARFENARAEGAASLHAFRYQPDDIPRGRSQDWRLALVPVRTEAQAVRVTWRGQDLRLSDGQRFHSDQVALGLKRMARAGLVAELEAGGFFWSQDESDPHLEPAVAVGLRSGTDAPGPPLQVTLRLSRDVFTLWQAEVARVGAGRKIVVGWERESDYLCAAHSSPTVTSRIRLGLRDTLGQRTILELEGSREETQEVFFGESRFHTDRAGLAIARALRPRLALRAASQYLSQFDDDPAAHSRTQRVRFEVSILGSMP